MKLIIGLGNPGNEYVDTRHNVGFKVIDEIAHQLELKINHKKFDCEFFANSDFILIKPLTYMNLSGEAIKSVMNFYKLNHNDILVICDDLDTKVGQAKIKISSSSGGHNGIKSIINSIGTSEFYRLKIGIGRPENKNFEISKYVLSKFSDEEIKIMNKVIKKSAEAAISSIYNSINYVVNKFNTKNKQK